MFRVEGLGFWATGQQCLGVGSGMHLIGVSRMKNRLRAYPGPQLGGPPSRFAKHSAPEACAAGCSRLLVIATQRL